MRADHGLGSRRGGGDLVDVEGGGVRGEHGAGLGDLVEGGEDVLLHCHLLEDGLDHDVRLADRPPIQRARDEPHPLVHVGLGEPSLLDGARVVLLHDAETAVESLLGHLHDGDGDAGVGEVHRDASAHRPGADDGRALDLPGGRARRHVGDLGRLALGEEGVDLPLGLGRGHALLEELALALESLREGQRHRRLHRLDALEGREIAPRLALDALLEGLEEGRVLAGGLELVVRGRDLPEGLLLGHELLGEGDGARAEILAHHLVHDAELLGPRRAHGIAAHDHLEGGLGADQARQPLRAAGARQEAELDLGQPHLPRGDGDAIVTGQTDLEPAAERRAVNGGHHGLGARFDLLEHAVQIGRLGRLAELADIGARDEGAPAADDDHGADAGIVDSPGQALDQPLAHPLGERVDGWIVDGDDADAALLFEADELAHEAPP